MFGRQNDQPTNHNSEEASDASLAEDSDSGVTIKGEKVVTPTKGKPAFGGHGANSGNSNASQGWSHPGTPVNDKTSQGKPSGGHSDFIATPRPAGSSHTAPSESAATSSSQSSPSSNANADDDTLQDLIQIKQQALNNLSPLIDHLDQPPAERFRTLLMMIQASDDQKLVKEAYAVAQTIEDEKIRAQALLDIVNEINYFTSFTNQQHAD